MTYDARKWISATRQLLTFDFRLKPLFSIFVLNDFNP